MPGKVLTVAESDASGAAGIQADIKTVLAFGGYASTAISSVLAQGPGKMTHFCDMDPEWVAGQMRVALNNIGADVIKVGYLPHEGVVNAVADVLDEIEGQGLPVIVDPSIVARDGALLVSDAEVAAWKRRLYIRTTVLTPNLREAEVLTGMRIRDVDDMRHAADMMRTLGVDNVLLKAGQAFSEKVVYFVADGNGETIYERDMLPTGRTLGAGCTLSAAIAVSLAQGLTLGPALERALDFVHQAILHAHGSGDVAGPMNHAFDIEKHSSFFAPGSVRARRA